MPSREDPRSRRFRNRWIALLRSSLRERAIALLRAHPSRKAPLLKQQQSTLDPDFRLKLLENPHA